MNRTIEFAESALDDLELIFDFLVESYMALGDSGLEAYDKARKRVLHIQSAADRIGTAPKRGESHDDLIPGLRHLTLNKAVYWFDILDDGQKVRILAVFYGGQDHRRKMLIRLLNR